MWKFGELLHSGSEMVEEDVTLTHDMIYFENYIFRTAN